MRIRLAVALIAVLLSLVAAEVLLRAAGRPPWRTSERFRREPTMVVADPRLGWRNRPGRYVVPPYSALGQPIEVTVLPDGSRDTGCAADPTERTGEVLLVGGSVTFGWAIADRDTLAWRLSKALASGCVTNLASPAYGTLQSLMTMEWVFESGRRPSRVLYGFIPHHVRRNVADADWLRVLSQHATRRTVEIPFATLGPGDGVIRHAPIRYPAWPLHEASATVAFAERLFADWDARDRLRDADEVTARLVVGMDALAQRHGARFSVLLLWSEGGGADSFRRLLGDREVDVIDCVRPMTPDDLVPGEGHPSGKMNARWAECLGARLRAELS